MRQKERSMINTIRSRRRNGIDVLDTYLDLNDYTDNDIPKTMQLVHPLDIYNLSDILHFEDDQPIFYNTARSTMSTTSTHIYNGSKTNLQHSIPFIMQCILFLFVNMLYCDITYTLAFKNYHI